MLDFTIIIVYKRMAQIPIEMTEVANVSVV